MSGVYARHQVSMNGTRGKRSKSQKNSSGRGSGTAARDNKESDSDSPSDSEATKSGVTSPPNMNFGPPTAFTPWPYPPAPNTAVPVPLPHMLNRGPARTYHLIMGSAMGVNGSVPQVGMNGGPQNQERMFYMPDGSFVPLHHEWTRGNFVLVCQPLPTALNMRIGYRVNVNVLINASEWFKNEVVAPPEMGCGVRRDHVVVYEMPEVAELLMRFLHLGAAGHDAAHFRPSVDQYLKLFQTCMKLQCKPALCQVLRHHCDVHASDLVDTLGRTPTKEDVFKLLDLARVLRSSGIWNAVLDNNYSTGGWMLLHNPWDLDFTDVFHNNETYNVLLLIQRLAATDDCPLQEFRVGYDATCRPHVYHQDTPETKFGTY